MVPEPACKSLPPSSAVRVVLAAVVAVMLFATVDTGPPPEAPDLSGIPAARPLIDLG